MSEVDRKDSYESDYYITVRLQGWQKLFHSLEGASAPTPTWTEQQVYYGIK